MRRRWSILLIVATVLLIRLPFLNQAVQGDDPKFIWIAEHALIDPLHPNHTQYIFQGESVDMRGHPHPPGNSYVLAGLIALFGDVREVPFHLVYCVFTVIAVVAMYFLARRFSPDDPVIPVLLFLAVPAFVINGNSFESDVPFVAWWLAGFALFTSGRPLLAVIPLALAAMTSYQALVATPILLLYCWMHARASRALWIVAFIPAVVVLAYQLWEKATGGALPATVLVGYFSSYGLQRLENKFRNAVALTAHLGFMVFPLATVFLFLRSRLVLAMAGLGALAGVFIDSSPLFWVPFGVGAGIVAWLLTLRPYRFLQVWALLFFAFALVAFFAGSARYLLPIAAPLAILAGRALPRRVSFGAVAANLAVSLAVAVVNYQHWNGYRQITLPQRRVWVNGEWPSFYAEAQGALPLTRKQIVQPGEWIVSSALGFPISVTAPLGLVQEKDIVPSLPIRIIGVGAKSGYSAAAFGFRPFDFSTAPVDRVRVEAVLERLPTLSWLPMNAPEASTQLVSGVYQPEGNTRWMSGRATILLKKPDQPVPLEVDVYVPDAAPGRTFVLMLDGTEVLRQTVPAPGPYKLQTVPVTGQTLTIVLDKTFSVAGDFRDLGAVLSAVGFRPR